MANWRINPERTNIEPLIADNPYYRSKNMYLWAECEISTFLKQHPETLIKPRSEKQKAVAEKLAEHSKLEAE